jgi:hypothetical protein
MNLQPNDELYHSDSHSLNNTLCPGKGYQNFQQQDGVRHGEQMSNNANTLRRHKHHRKRHVLPGPAGLLPNKGTHEDEGKDPPHNTSSTADSACFSWTQPQLVGSKENSIHQRSPSHHVIIAPAWRAMCAALDRWIPPTGFSGSSLNCTNLHHPPGMRLSLRQQIKRRLPPNFALLSDIVSSSIRRSKTFFVVVMIASVQCHLHCDWTCELVDDDDERRVVLGWLEDAFVRKVSPEVMARPGVVLLLRNVVMTAFRNSKEDNATEDQEPEPMFLIGENSVISMWLPSEEHDTRTTSNKENEQTDMDMMVEPFSDSLPLKKPSEQRILETDMNSQQSQANTLTLTTIPETNMPIASTTAQPTISQQPRTMRCRSAKEEEEDDNFEDFEGMNEDFFVLESGAASGKPEEDRNMNSIHNNVDTVSSQHQERLQIANDITHDDEGMLPNNDVTNDSMLLDSTDLFHQTDFLEDLSD